MRKPADTSVVLHPILAERWSPRSFNPEARISTDDITAMLEAARWAPSANNGQPWSFIFGRRGDENFVKITASLAGFNQVWAPNASALVVIVAQMVSQKGEPNPMSLYDCGLAASLLTIEACHRGYAVHQMAGFDSSVINSEFHVGEERNSIVVIAIGIQASADHLDEGMARERENAPRERKPLAELLISGNL